MTAHEFRRGDYLISSDKDLLQFPKIHQMLKASYWANDRPNELTERSTRHSLVFGVYHLGEQVGFARVVTDEAVVGWILDVVIDPDHRGKGLGTWLMGVIMDDAVVKGLKKVILNTKDAHGLYEKFGFKVSANTGMMMEKKND